MPSEPYLMPSKSSEPMPLSQVSLLVSCHGCHPWECQTIRARKGERCKCNATKSANNKQQYRLRSLLVEGVDAILVDVILLSSCAQIFKCPRAKKGERYKGANNNQQCSCLLTLLVEGGSQLNLPLSGFPKLLDKKLSNIGN
jgi:hypothetical protein